MKYLYSIFLISILTLCCGLFSSCSDNDDNSSSVPSDFYGTYYTTVGNGKASIYATFNADKTGFLEYEWDTNVHYRRVEYTFTYSFSGNKVKCDGIEIDSEGSSSKRSMTFQYSSGTLTGGGWTIDRPYSKIN